MAITIFWLFLALSLLCALLSESIQVWRQKKYITDLSAATGINQSVRSLKEEEQTLRAGIDALKLEEQGIGADYIIQYSSLLDELAEELGGQIESEKLKQVRAEIKQHLKRDTAVNCSIRDKSERTRIIHLVTEAFNCKVESSLQKLKSTNVGIITAEIKNSYDIVNLNASTLGVSISKDFLNLRIKEAKLGTVIHQIRERQKEEQKALREEMREEERANRERERLAKEAERDELVKQEMLRAAQEAASNASEAERAIHQERVRQLEAEVDAAKAKTQRMSMAQMTRVGHVYVISNIGSFGEGVLKIGMTRRLAPQDRIDELGSASVPFGFDVHALVMSEDAPKLENDLHTYFAAHRVNKVNLRKEFFEVEVSKVKKFFEERGVNAKFTITAEAQQFKESQRINNMSADERLNAEHKLMQQQQFEETE